MKPSEIVLGMHVLIGLQQREAVVVELPVMVGERYFIGVECDGRYDEVPLSVVFPMGSRRRVALTSIVAGYNANVPREMQISRDALESLLKKAGLG